MTLQMTTEYDKHSIFWDDHLRWFYIELDDIKIKTGLRSLEDCKKWIDKRKKTKFQRVKIIHKLWRQNQKKPGEATSIVEDHYAWVTIDGQRGKERIDTIWLDNSKNRKALEQINSLNKKISLLRERIADIEKNADYLTAEMILPK